MKKKLMSILLTVSMLLSFVPTVSVGAADVLDVYGSAVTEQQGETPAEPAVGQTTEQQSAEVQEETHVEALPEAQAELFGAGKPAYEGTLTFTPETKNIETLKNYGIYWCNEDVEVTLYDKKVTLSGYTLVLDNATVTPKNVEPSAYPSTVCIKDIKDSVVNIVVTGRNRITDCSGGMDTENSTTDEYGQNVLSFGIYSNISGASAKTNIYFTDDSASLEVVGHKYGIYCENELCIGRQESTVAKPSSEYLNLSAKGGAGGINCSGKNISVWNAAVKAEADNPDGIANVDRTTLAAICAQDFSATDSVVFAESAFGNGISCVNAAISGSEVHADGRKIALCAKGSGTGSSVTVKDNAKLYCFVGGSNNALQCIGFFTLGTKDNETDRSVAVFESNEEKGICVNLGGSGKDNKSNLTVYSGELRVSGCSIGISVNQLTQYGGTIEADGTNYGIKTTDSFAFEGGSILAMGGTAAVKFGSSSCTLHRPVFKNEDYYKSGIYCFPTVVSGEKTNGSDAAEGRVTFDDCTGSATFPDFDTEPTRYFHAEYEYVCNLKKNSENEAREYYLIQQAVEDAAEGDIITLEKDIALPQPLYIAGEKTLTINMNRHDLTLSESVEFENSCVIHNYGKLTVVDRESIYHIGEKDCTRRRYAHYKLETISSHDGYYRYAWGEDIKVSDIRLDTKRGLYLSGTKYSPVISIDGGYIGSAQVGIFNEEKGELQLENVNITLNGTHGIVNKGDCTVDGGSIRLNHAAENGDDSGGAGVENIDGSFTADGTSFLYNTACQCGGAIQNREGTVSLKGCTVSGNSAHMGGGIYNVDGRFELIGSEVKDNTATVTVTGTNSKEAYGGGIMNNGELLIKGSLIAGNAADGEGGGIYNGNGTVIIETEANIGGNYAKHGSNTNTVSNLAIDETGKIRLKGDSISENTNVGIYWLSGFPKESYDFTRISETFSVEEGGEITYDYIYHVAKDTTSGHPAFFLDNSQGGFYTLRDKVSEAGEHYLILTVDPTCCVLDENGKMVKEYAFMQNALKECKANYTVRLVRDYAMSYSDSFSIPVEDTDGKPMALTLDLNGKILSRLHNGERYDGQVINNCGTLTVTDGSGAVKYYANGGSLGWREVPAEKVKVTYDMGGDSFTTTADKTLPEDAEVMSLTYRYNGIDVAVKKLVGGCISGDGWWSGIVNSGKVDMLCGNIILCGNGVSNLVSNEAAPTMVKDDNYKTVSEFTMRRDTVILGCTCGIDNKGIFTMQDNARIEQCEKGIYNNGIKLLSTDSGGVTVSEKRAIVTLKDHAGVADSGANGICTAYGTVFLNDYVFISGSADSALYSDSSVVEMNQHSRISGNTAKYGAGAYIFTANNFGSLTLNDSAEIVENTAKASGGGIFVDDNAVIYLNDNAGISGNTAASGGGIYGGSSGVRIYFNGNVGSEALGCRVENNVGGGVCIEGSVMMSGLVKVQNNTRSNKPCNLATGNAIAILKPGLAKDSAISLTWTGEVPDELGEKIAVTAKDRAVSRGYAYDVAYDTYFTLDDTGVYFLDNCIEKDDETGESDVNYVVISRYFAVAEINENESQLRASTLGSGYGESTVKYVEAGKVVSVDIKICGAEFIAADYQLVYNSSELTLLGENGAAGTPAGLKKTTKGSLTTLTGTYLDDDETKEDGTVIRTLKFRYAGEKDPIDSAITVAASVARTVEEKGDIGPMEEGIGTEIKLAPKYDVELVSDYIAGKALLLVYSDTDEVSFYYNYSVSQDTVNSLELIDLRDQYLTPKYTYNKVNGGSIDRLANGKVVSAIVLDDPGVGTEAALTITDVRARLTYEQTEELRNYRNRLDFNRKNQFDVNASGTIDMNDAVVVAEVYNGYPGYTTANRGTVKKLELVLKSDVNRDKKVTMDDVNLIMSNYGVGEYQGDRSN